MGGMHSVIFEPQFEDIKRWPWSRVTDISKNFRSNDYDYVLNLREFITLTGLSPDKADALALSFRKMERKKESEDTINVLVVIVACILLSDGMNEMISTRIDALFDLFDFNSTGNASLDALNILLICLTKALAGILNKNIKIEEQLIIEYTHNIFEVLERNLYDDQEMISKQEFHDYAQEAWEGLEEPELSCLFTLFSGNYEQDVEEGEENGEKEYNEPQEKKIVEDGDKENTEVVNTEEEVNPAKGTDGNSEATSKSHAEAAHSYANENKDTIGELKLAAKKYNETLQIAMIAKQKYLSSSVDYDLDANSQASLVTKLKAYQLMELSLDKLHDADTTFRKWLSHHRENNAPEQLLLALQKYHDDRLSDIKEVEQTFKEAKESGILENLGQLDTVSSEMIKGTGSLRDDSSVVTDATGATLAKIMSESKEPRPPTRDSQYTDASYSVHGDGSEVSHSESDEGYRSNEEK